MMTSPAQALTTDEIELSKQFAILIYPFRHGIPGNPPEGFDPLLWLRREAVPEPGRRDRLEALNSAWQPWWARLTEGERRGAIDDTFFFLPHVRDLMFPGLCSKAPVARPLREAIERQDLKSALAEIDRLVDRGTGSLADLPADTVLRLTYQSEHLAGLRSLELAFELKRDGKVLDEFHAPFKLAWVDLALFPQETGLLMIKVQLDEPAPTVARLRDFYWFLRLVHPPTIEWTLPTWQVGTGESRLSFKARDFLDYLLQGLVDPHGPIEADFTRYLAQIANRPRYTSSDLGQTYGQIFHIYSYGLIKRDPAQPLAVLAGEDPEQPQQSPLNRALYELATTTALGDPDSQPDPAYLDDLLKTNIFARWRNWKALALHDHVSFLGTREMGRNVENDYLNLYIITWFQKIRLSMMFRDQMTRDFHLDRNLKRARKLWNDFLVFQDHYWFSEATRSRQGTELYRHYRQALDVMALHCQLSSQVHELRDYHEGKSARRLGLLMNALAFVGVPLNLVLALFGQTIVTHFLNEPWKQGVATIVVVLLFVAIYFLWRNMRMHE